MNVQQTREAVEQSIKDAMALVRQQAKLTTAPASPEYNTLIVAANDLNCALSRYLELMDAPEHAQRRAALSAFDSRLEDLRRAARSMTMDELRDTRAKIRELTPKDAT
jgi:hypothetical protein